MAIYNFFTSLIRGFSKLFTKESPRFLAMKKPKFRRDRYAKSLGFTLIEVLVVMIMVGILSAIAAPSWLGFVNNQRINTSQTKIFQAIKVAQADAKVRNASNERRVRLTFTIGQTDNAYRLDNVRTDGGTKSLEAGVTISSITTPPSVVPPNNAVIPPGNSGSPYIEFDSRGFVYDPNNQLTYPICINLSVANSPKIRWIAIKTLLGAVFTGSEGSCS